MFDTLGGFTLLDVEPRVLDVIFKIWRKRQSDIGGTIYFKRANGIHLWYHNLTRYLGLSFSAPKLLYGTNAKLVYERDFPKVEKEVYKIIKGVLGWEIVNALPKLGDWEANRVDYCYNHYVKYPADKKYYIQAIAKTELGHYKKRVYPTSVFFFNKSAKFVVYDKSSEMEARGKKPSRSQRRILRTEAGIRRKKIKSFFKDNTKIKDVFRDDVSMSVLGGYYYFKLFIDGCFLTQAQLHSIIQDSFDSTWTKKLTQFVEVVNTDGVKLAKEEYKRTYNNNISKLRSLDKNLIYLDNKVQSPISFKIILPKDVLGVIEELKRKKNNFIAFLMLLFSKGLDLITSVSIEILSYYYEEGG